MSTPLRLALLTYSTRPRGGVVHTLALAEALAARGHEVDVWSLARGGDGGFFRPVDPAVRLRLVPFPDVADEPVGTRIVRSMAALGEAFTAAELDAHNDDDRYDIVHAQDCITANAVPRCVRTVHHLDTFTTPELAACHERAIVRPYAHICVSAAVADEVRAGWGIAATVIPNGVAAQHFAAGVDDLAGRARWADRLGRYVLAVGGIEPRKGSAELIEAMAIVQRRDPGLTLAVAGGETLFDYRDYRTAVLGRAQQLGVRVELLGSLPHAELPSLMAQAAVFAFPSVKEGFGLAAMEAMAAGVPVVMRDLPVLREVFEGAAVFAVDEQTLAAGLLAAAAAADPARVAAGRTLAARHTWDSAAAAHEVLYRSLVDGYHDSDSSHPGNRALKYETHDKGDLMSENGETSAAGAGLTDEEMVEQVNDQTPSEERYKDVFEREKDGTTTDTEAAKATGEELSGE